MLLPLDKLRTCRYQSPRSTRLSSENLSNSYGADGSSPGGVFLRRPNERRRSAAEPSPQADFAVRKEGFDPESRAASSASQLATQPKPQAADSPAKPQGLLSRTFSGANGAPGSDAIKVGARFLEASTMYFQLVQLGL